MFIPFLKHCVCIELPIELPIVLPIVLLTIILAWLGGAGVVGGSSGGPGLVSARFARAGGVGGGERGKFMYLYHNFSFSRQKTCYSNLFIPVFRYASFGNEGICKCSYR